MENKVPKTTQALAYNHKTKSLSLESLAVPQADGPEDHLIKVHAVAITNGELTWAEPAALEKSVPGFELSGMVVSAPAHSPFPPGTNVYARTAFERHGSARPFSIATTQELGRMPSNVSWEEAATVPLSALTAWQALFVHGGLAPPGRDADIDMARKRNADKRVLVTAAAGGVGIWATQLAALAGAYVVGTCGTANADFVKDLGADEVLDYKTINLSDWVNEDPAVRKFHLALDSVGGKTLEQTWRSVRDDGKLVSIVLPPEKHRPEQGVGLNVSGVFFIVDANRGQLDEISHLIEQGKWKTTVDSVFPLQDFEQAFKRAYGGHVRGKVVLKVNE